MMQTLWKPVWQFLKFLKIALPYDPSNSSSRYSPEVDLKAGFPKDNSIATFTAALFRIAKMWKQSQCPSADEWISKMWNVIHCRKEGNSDICYNTDEP